LNYLELGIIGGSPFKINTTWSFKMTTGCDAVIDLGWGSSGKGGIAGYLATQRSYTAVLCAYGRQAGHTYNNARLGIKMMVQQLPVGIVSETVKDVFIGPGAIIHEQTLVDELERYSKFMGGKRLFIHEHAAVVTDEHSDKEMSIGQTKMGSTGKGVGQAMIDRILRDPNGKATARLAFVDSPLQYYVTDRATYDAALQVHLGPLLGGPRILIEGAQGFGLSIYHGDYPYVTSRDVTPGQLFADCALPWSFYDKMHIIGVTRTRPIRVNNRDGYSGPCYPDQRELSWEEVGVAPEKTTVTQLERRIFNYSRLQTAHAAHICLKPSDSIALTFCDYCDYNELRDLASHLNSLANLRFTVYGPDDSDVIEKLGEGEG
jgi:adenylosuccinate synthase